MQFTIDRGANKSRSAALPTQNQDAAMPGAAYLQSLNDEQRQRRGRAITRDLASREGSSTGNNDSGGVAMD
jgi:hypothetical protein